MKKESKKTKKHKKENWLNKFIPKTKSEKIITCLFIILLILVITLSVIALKTVNKKKTDDITNTVSITDKGSNYIMNIEVSDMKPQTTKEYKFKVKNYNKKILSEDLDYTITVNELNNPVIVKIYKNNKLLDLDNLKMTLKKDDPQEDIYKVIIKSTKQISKDKSIALTILS